MPPEDEAPLRLVPYAASDLALTTALETDPTVMSRLGGPVPADRIQAIHDKRLKGRENGDRFYTIVPAGPAAASGRSGAEPAVKRPPQAALTTAIGIVGVWHTPLDGEVLRELGVMILPGAFGRRLGPMACRMLIELIRSEEPLPRVDAFADVDNDRSNAGLRWLGFRIIGERDMDYEGRPLRCYHWVLD
jgi:RimJ/RimL family protein N-acetyltransferase